MKLSIITINFNNAAGLKRTFESVVAQTYDDFEYIVIDGDSNDGSKELINKYTSKISYSISEKDKGIYNAMNKGLNKAKGEYVLFLNSGDCLINSEILNKVAPYLIQTGIVYGDGLFFKNDGTSEMIRIPEVLDMKHFSKTSLFHPSSFIRKELFDKFGPYNEENKIVSDWEFFLKTIIINKASTKKIDRVISVAEDGGMSRDERNRALVYGEVDQRLKVYFSEDEIKALNIKRTITPKTEVNDLSKNGEKQSFKKIIKKILKNSLPFYISNKFIRQPVIIKTAKLEKEYKKFLVSGNSVFNSNFDIRVDKPVNGKSYATVGKDCVLNCKIIFESDKGEVIIDDRTFIGTSEIICREKILFGSNIFVSWDCIFIDNDSHSLNYLDRQDDLTQLLTDLRREGPLVENKNWNTVRSKPIKVCDNAWIGMRSIILKGVTIGEGAIVAAGSVVASDVPAWSIVAGNPAKVVREIPEELRKR